MIYRARVVKPFVELFALEYGNFVCGDSCEMAYHQLVTDRTVN